MQPAVAASTLIIPEESTTICLIRIIATFKCHNDDNNNACVDVQTAKRSFLLPSARYSRLATFPLAPSRPRSLLTHTHETKKKRKKAYAPATRGDYFYYIIMTTIAKYTLYILA